MAKIPLRAVAALFLERQHLRDPRRRRLTERNLVRFASDTGGIQLDSINVIDRAHYLTVWSRFGPYDRRVLDRLVYERRAMFEYWAHAACLVPTDHFGHWRRAMLDYSLRSRAWGKWLRKNAALVAQVEAEITTRGPLGNADFGNDRKRRGGGWWNWKPATHALDYLWMSGRTMIHSRVHFQKRFDLAPRVMGEALAAEPPRADEFRRWHLRRSLHAMGAATATDLRMYLTFPRTEIRERRKALAEALAAGEVVEVAVEHGTTPWFALADDLPALRAAAQRRVAARGTTLLAPFDSFLWHRERAQRLFGFDYRVEVYTPGHKRVHGYYVLPLFHDGQLIGRIDAKTHRAERLLEIRQIHFEPWFARGKRPPAADWGSLDRDLALDGAADAFRSLATFVGAETITLGRVSPPAMAASLRRRFA
ncbi:MAG TPA: crosslink repair DNA glycosylase YcaQ family protein [Candidatus Polarisedimenticolaceae bacterium]|nr:crosslink repair DNA glycosylase YcaQ family protein [Candidatus Polarisedimenticolaceae bacterium]